MREREYDKIKAINNSMLKHFKRSPEHYIHALKEGSPPPTPAMQFGIAFHSYVLEEHNFLKDIAVLDENKRPVPDKDYRTKANAEWKEAFFQENKDKTVITSEQMETIKRMKDKVMNHELAGELLTMGTNRFEYEMTWNWKKTRCKGLADVRNDSFLLDLKTTQDANPDEWMRQFFRMDYHRQAGMYLDGDANGKLDYSGKWKDFYFVAIEPTEPHSIAVYKPRRQVIEKGLEEYRTLCEQFQSCIDNKIWQGYEFKSVAGHLFEIDLPSYLKD